MSIKITLISHASVLIETPDAIIWTDPWITGRAFNDSWALCPEPTKESFEKALKTTSHIWISHEHPDHFNLPTLKMLPSDFKKRVTLLFQHFPTNKMIDAFQMLGFEKIVRIKHRAFFKIADQTSVYLYQAAPLDSALGVIASSHEVVLNINDCQLSRYDYGRIKKDLRPITVVLNQYSFATYNGRIDHDQRLPRQALRVLESAAEAHQELDAKYTIPFASLMYFCMTDNEHLNAYRNRITDFHDYFMNKSLQSIVLVPGQSYSLGEIPDNTSALHYYETVYAKALAIFEPPKIPFEDIRVAGRSFFSEIEQCYPRFLLEIIGKFIICVPDLKCWYALDFKTLRLYEVAPDETNWNLRINSQPLLFVLSNRFGLQTLTISGRFTIQRKYKRFLLLRVILGLWNSEIYFRFKRMSRLRGTKFYFANSYRYIRQGASLLASIL